MPKKRLFGERKRRKGKKAIKTTKSIFRSRKPASKYGNSRSQNRRTETVTVRKISPVKKTKSRTSTDSSSVREDTKLMINESSSETTDEDVPLLKAINKDISAHRGKSSRLSLREFDDNSIEVSPVKEPKSPDLSRAIFHRCGSHYDQWKDKVFSQLPEKSKSKHMVLVKLLEKNSPDWPDSVDAYDALGVIFLSKAGSIKLDCRVRNMRLLGRKDEVKVKTKENVEKHLGSLTKWMGKCRNLVEDNKLNAAFEGLVSATIAFFDESLLIESTESFARKIKSLSEIWEFLMLKRDDELEIDPISRDGVVKLLSEVRKQIPKSITSEWDRTIKTIKDKLMCAELSVDVV